METSKKGRGMIIMSLCPCCRRRDLIKLSSEESWCSYCSGVKDERLKE
jgi:hypothetical protein